MQCAMQEQREAPESSGGDSMPRALQATPHWREAALAIIPPFACSRLLLIAVTGVVALVLRRSPLSLWQQYDAKWYLGIATHGYGWSLYGGLRGHSSLAFFPLYPLLVHVASETGFRPWWRQ